MYYFSAKKERLKKKDSIFFVLQKSFLTFKHQYIQVIFQIVFFLSILSYFCKNNNMYHPSRSVLVTNSK